ncbi:ferrochelatase [Paracrocinitomix mangrovi]|uniref:ferrochelatase n=1 Tax=Paracrocinitomix mangrovi TaxID=2862509 RepID=UPI001C8E54EC|nr:ferrochelatase [Paracrocinitomix mangrovi]UKN03048.1 ferrochelatase [Paracrocinitomix mangrovi]
MKKTGVLLINLGTPDSPNTKDVRKYLTEFLNDPRVIDISAFGRFLLVNGIIVPFRAPKSAKIYKELWDLWNGESPLLTFGNILKKELQEKFKNEPVTVELAMRYQNPSLDEVLARMEKQHYEKIIILPLFPHYASASTGSAVEKAMRLIKQWQAIPGIKIIPQFYNEPGFIQTIIERTKKHDISSFDHVLFSYHGIPERQLEKQHPDLKCANCTCHEKFNEDHPLCYRNTCYETTRLIVKELDLKEGQYTTCFQSRLGKTPWLTPFSDKVIEDLVKAGSKRLLAFSPAFIADCLETSIEIGDEYQEIVEEHGGEKIQLVESLNDSTLWIDTVEKMVREQF